MTQANCEPQRRSHGGRTYDHVDHATGTKRTRLEDIRLKVETGGWEMTLTKPQD